MPLQDPLSAVLFAKSQSAVLGLLYGHPDEAFYLRQVAQLTSLGVGHAQRELNRLAEAGILLRTRQGMHVYFKANPACPVFPELRAIVTKTVGAGGLLRSALQPLAGTIVIAFIFGSVASGLERAASDLDLMVIGNASLADVAVAIKTAEMQLLRSVNPVIYPLAEFRDKLAAGQHFLTAVMNAPKLFLFGSEHELRSLLEKWLDTAARDFGRRSQTVAGVRRPRHRAKPSPRT